MPNWIGLDVHKRTCHATVLDERGVVVQTKLQNEPEELKRFFENFDDAKVAMEAAYFWQPVYELIEQLGHEVVLAHPKETRIIAKQKVKTDAKDSGPRVPAAARIVADRLRPAQRDQGSEGAGEAVRVPGPQADAVQE